MRIASLLIFTISLQALEVTAQQRTINIDSLESSILTLPDDTAKVNRWNDLVGKIQFENPDRAIKILRSSRALADRIDYAFGLSVTYTHRASLFFYEMNLDSSKLLLDKAYALVYKNADIRSRKQIAFIVLKYGGIYQQKQKYDSAVLRYLEAASIFTALGDKSKVIQCYFNLSGIYNSLEDTAKSVFYARETRRIAIETNDAVYIMRSLMALADAFVNAKRFDSARVIAKEGLTLANKDSSPFPIGKFHMLLGTYYMNKEKQYDSALFHFNSALQAFTKINLGYEVALVLQNMGHVYLQQKDYLIAVDYLKKSAAHSKDLKLDQLLRTSLMDLVQAEEMAGNLSESLRYLKEYVAVNDSVLQRNNRQMVYDLETNYQTQKKEALLQAQGKLIKQKNLLNYLFAAIMISVVLISFILYYMHLQKRKLQQQRINELEKEKRLSASEAVIKAQEDERGRLAKDLHDGIGGLLSGIKFSLTNMKSNVVLDADHALVFERSLDMLDHSISELRRVAHNMMPEVLVKFGLTEALKSYCESLQQSGIYQIDFQHIGLTKSLPSQMEIILYRIVQELLNNTAKHAKATHVLVQVAMQDNDVTITVEDNGVGFDPAALAKSAGAGWSNIRSRIDYLKGKVDIQSKVQQGTSVHLSIPVEP